MAPSAETPLSECPVCSTKFNAAAAINEPGIYQTPHAGDTTVCRECLTWLVFRDDLSVRRMTELEMRGLEKEEREQLVELSRAINKVNELQQDRNPKVRK